LLAVALGGVGSYLTFYQQTGTQTITVTPVVTTAETTQATVRPSRPIEWIQVGQVKPINYYLSLLESNGTQPYVQLAKELRNLPELTNATAVAKITYLALNASNPEVKEAFELLIKEESDGTDCSVHSVRSSVCRPRFAEDQLASSQAWVHLYASLFSFSG